MLPDVKKSEAYDIVNWESWVKAGRTRVGSDFIRFSVIEINAMLVPKGWKPIEIVYEKEYTSLFDRSIYFELKGQRYAIAWYQKILADITGARWH